MLTQIAPLLKDLENITLQNLEQASFFASLPLEDLTWKPAPKKWSIAECLEHLNIYSRYYLPVLEQALQIAPTCPVPSYRQGWLGALFVKIVRLGTNKNAAYKMAALTAYNPKNTFYDPCLVVAEFVQHQQKTNQLLRQGSMHDLSVRLIPISIVRFLKLNMADTFQFLVYHNERHVYQAIKNLKEINQNNLGTAAAS